MQKVIPYGSYNGNLHKYIINVLSDKIRGILQF